MFEKYHALIATLKTEKYSVLVHQARENILAALQSDTFSRRLRGVLESRNCALSEFSVIEITKLQKLVGVDVPKIGDIDAEGEYKTIAFTPEEIEEIKGALDKRLSNSARKLRAKFEEIDPFNHYAEDPAQISQIKKLINALYHAEKALKDLESITYSFKDLNVVNPTIEHIYQAAMLATHLDLDLGEIFSEELSVLTSLLAKFQASTEKYNKGAVNLLSKIEVANIPHDVGFAAGVLVDQMGAKSGEVDYKFITQISADMPKYLDKLTGYIHKFSSEVSVHEPTIDKKKLQELENEALKLLHTLENMRGNSLWLPLKTLNFIRIIRHTITLSISIFQQIGFLNEKSQDVICDNLEILKNTLLPELLGLADKIEQHALLNPAKPGFLSDSLFRSVSKLYESLVGYAGKVVDFSKKGSALVTLDDAAFVEARLAMIFKRRAENQRKYVAIDKAQRAATQFFDILVNPKYKTLRVIDLAEEVRGDLIRHYKLFQPYVLSLDIPWNNAIIGCLLGKKDLLDNLPSLPLLGYLGNSPKIQNILSDFKPLLTSWFTKACNTNQFDDKLSFDTAVSVSNYMTDLKTQRKNPLRIDETTAFGIIINQPTPLIFKASKTIEDDALSFQASTQGNQLQYPLQLSIEQSSQVVQFYGEKQAQLDVAQKAYDDFYNLLDINQMLTVEQGNSLQSLYSLFQPYLIYGDSIHFASDVLKQLNDGIVTILSEPGLGADVKTLRLRELFATVFSASEADALSHLNVNMKKYFQSLSEPLQVRAQIFERTVNNDLAKKNEEKELVQDLRHAARAYHLIKHESYSKTMSGLRASLLNLMGPFNQPLKKQLYNPFMTAQINADKEVVEFNKGIKVEKDKKSFKPFSQLPFPELLDVNQLLAESSQVLGLKQLFNCTYHLEQASVQLEKLSDKDSKIQYAQTVYAMITHLQEVKVLAQALADNPGLAYIKGEVMGELKRGYAAFMNVRTHYFPSVNDESGNDAKEHDALFYVLNSLMIIPEHITVLHRSESVLAERASEIEELVKNKACYKEVLTCVKQGSYHESLELINAMVLMPQESQIYSRITLDVQKKLSEWCSGSLSLDKTRSIHKHAEKVSADIQRIIRKSSSYFKLLFEIPTMFRLFGDLKIRLAKLASASHDVVFENLAAINDKGLTAILMEADQWEDSMGLNAGSLTTPMKEVLDAFYQGLLEPLGLPSKQHVSLVASQSSVEQRRASAASRADKAVLEQTKIEENLVTLKLLLERIHAYKTCSPKAERFGAIKELMVEAFQKALPILTTQTHLMAKISAETNSEQLDALLGSNEQGIVNVEGLAHATSSYFAGLKASHQLRKDTIQEKIAFLDTLKAKEIERKEHFIEQYTRASFERQSSLLSSKQVGLLHCMVEYRDKLKAHMKTAEEEIVNKAKSAEDIDHEVGELLREKGAEFEKGNYKNYYHLENVMAVIGRLNTYLYKSNMAISKQKKVPGKELKIVAESATTLEPKTELAVQLNKLANEKTLSVEERLLALKDIVMAPLFKTKIEKSCQHDKFTWKWVCQCILSLVELLGLYTPERKRCYQRLVKAIEPSSEKLNKLSQQYGLFSSSARNSEAVSEEPEQPSIPRPAT